MMIAALSYDTKQQGKIGDITRCKIEISSHMIQSNDKSLMTLQDAKYSHEVYALHLEQSEALIVSLCKSFWTKFG